MFCSILLPKAHFVIHTYMHMHQCVAKLEAYLIFVLHTPKTYIHAHACMHTRAHTHLIAEDQLLLVLIFHVMDHVCEVIQNRHVYLYASFEGFMLSWYPGCVQFITVDMCRWCKC